MKKRRDAEAADAMRNENERKSEDGNDQHHSIHESESWGSHIHDPKTSGIDRHGGGSIILVCWCAHQVCIRGSFFLFNLGIILP